MYKILVIMSRAITHVSYSSGCAVAIDSRELEFGTQEQADFAYECLVLSQRDKVDIQAIKMYRTLDRP